MNTYMLKPSSSWCDSSIVKPEITKITFAKDSTPTTYTKIWDASTDNSITGYLVGTEIIVTWTGSDKIYASEDASWMFCDSEFLEDLTTEQRQGIIFSSLTEIVGLDLIDVSNTQNFLATFGYCIALKTLDLSSWNVSNATTTRYMFGALTSIVPDGMALETITLGNWETPNNESMAYMFYNCNKLSTLNVSAWNVSSVTTMKNAFSGCELLTTLDVSNWNTSNVTEMSSMFSNCESLTALDVSNWDVSNVITMHFMFNKCTSLRYLDVSGWDTRNVVDMGAMFQGSTHASSRLVIRIKGIEGWNTSNVENMGWMFYSIRLLPEKGNDTATDYVGDYDLSAIYELDLSGWDVSKVKSFHHMFAHSANIYLKGIENWRIGAKVDPVEGDDKSYISMNCFLHCTVNETYDLSNWDVSKVRDFRGMFRMCKKLVKVHGLDKWNTSNGKSFAVMFSHCVSMTELDVSGFDTRNASKSYKDPYRDEDYDSYTGVAMQGFFGLDSSTETGTNMQRVTKIKVGENFSFNGDGSETAPAKLPTIDLTIFPDADGKWYTVSGDSYTPGEEPNQQAITYYVTAALAETAREDRVTVKYNTLFNIANALRDAGEEGKFLISQADEKIRSVVDKLHAEIDRLTEELNNVPQEDPYKYGIPMSEFLETHPNFFETYTTGTYTIGNSATPNFEKDFRFYVNCICTNSKTFDYSTMDDYGCVVFKDIQGIYANTTPTLDQILNNPDSVVYTKEQVDLAKAAGYNVYRWCTEPLWYDSADIVHYSVPYMKQGETLHVRSTVHGATSGKPMSLRGVCQALTGGATEGPFYTSIVEFLAQCDEHFARN